MIVRKQRSITEDAIYTTEYIKEGTLLFTMDDWKEDEKTGWTLLTVDEISQLSGEQRQAYLKYSYDVDFGLTIGTFDWKYARHISNFMNHSCTPNMIYDTQDGIIAARDIQAWEELTIDYGTFVVNFDQEFICGCGEQGCRHRIYHDDWKKLSLVYGLHFPSFMHQALQSLFAVNAVSGMHRQIN